MNNEQRRHHRLETKFLLDENNVPYPCEDLMTWGQGFEELTKSGRGFVKQESVGRCRVSTVFLGINCSYGGDGEPLLFETMVFGAGDNNYMDRYTTWAEAEEGHKAIVAMVKMAEEVKE